MSDALFEEPRLARLYDVLESARPDLDAYLAIARELGATRVLDVGCGTGTFACLLARHGIDVTAVDPAAASLDVARHKAFAERVRWVLGDATTAPNAAVDLVTMTGNVAQVFVADDDWVATLRAAHARLHARGRLVFEVRDPDREAWRAWTREKIYRCFDLPDVGRVETWTDLVDATPALVHFRHHFLFGSDQATVVSDSVLRFRTRFEITSSLRDAGFRVDDVRDAPDRPGLELVFVASRGEDA